MGGGGRRMSEEDFDKKLADLEGRIRNDLNNYITPVYGSMEKLKTEIEIERVELKDKLTKAEAKLKIYEAMFKKLNLNINLYPADKEEE